MAAPKPAKSQSARSPMEPVRVQSDEQVLLAFAEGPHLTRAQLSKLTGLSKPTVNDSIRRTEALGLVEDTGVRTSTRGGVGTYYQLSPSVTRGLAISIDQDHVRSEIVDISGASLHWSERHLLKPFEPDEVIRQLRETVTEVTRGIDTTPQVTVVSVADPVDRRTGSLVRSEDSPFLLGDVSLGSILTPFTTCPILVDNDVNWIARAEQHATVERFSGDFVYAAFGEGIGTAVVNGGEVTRGFTGLAGEVLHVITTGPDGRAMPLTKVIDSLGLRTSNSVSLDVDRVKALLDSDTDDARVLVRALADLLAAAIAYIDPESIVVGGAWGTHPPLLPLLSAELGRHVRTVPLRAPEVRAEPALSGVRLEVVAQLWSLLLNRMRSPVLDS